jgi:zinc protease
MLDHVKTALRFSMLVLLVPAILAGLAPARSAMDRPEIKYEKFVLDNGLTLIVHEDHKAPIVAVNVWYHVGSKNEKPGRTGFAHLFEHLMFNGSENYNKDYFEVLERIGATDLNGTTNEDRTNYFQNVPKSALDTVLWMESDRMGHLLGAVDQAKLDEQRGVVQNEKRQGENEPYAVAYELITKACFPAGHPYSWTVIGSMEDLSAASLDDVKEWFKTYYGPSNAVIVLAGDIDSKTALEKVKRYFGDIPPGPPVAHHEAWIAKRSGTQKQRVEDRVPQARLYKVWNVPQRGTADAAYLDLLASVLSNGKSSRLYKRLVYDDQIATSVDADLDVYEIAGLFIVTATAKPGGDLAAVERAVDEEIQKLLASGPTADELERAKTADRSSFIRGVERIGGFGGKSDVLAQSQVYLDSPDAYLTNLDRKEAATAADLKAAGNRWLSDGAYSLDVLPFPTYTAATSGVDRAKVPEPGAAPVAEFPKTQRATLANGLKIVVAERHAVPVVNIDLLVDAGYASDQFATPGTAELAMSMLDEGTAKRSALEISDELDRLGANLGAGSELDSSVVTLSALKANLDASLDVFADVILNPAFPQADFDRLKKQQLAAIQREKVQPIGMALRVFPRLLYGKDHAYGLPLTGSGYESSVPKIERADLVKFHETWFRPNHATLIIVGDTTLEEIRPRIEARFKDWKQGKIPEKNLARVDSKPTSGIYLVDRPGSIQSIILAGVVAPPKSNPDEISILAMNTILGGAFVSRLNMNLREDKHWSYGAGSFLLDAKGQRPFVAYGPVQTDKTKESMQEIAKELKDVTGARPPTADELAKAQDELTRTLPGTWETGDAVAGSISEIVRFGLPDDYFTTFPGKVRALSTANLADAAKKVIDPDDMVWIVIGDRAVIEPRLKELGWGEILLLNPDGERIPG